MATVVTDKKKFLELMNKGWEKVPLYKRLLHPA